jgi:acyl carrier protein
MLYEDYDEVIRSKVRGALHFHDEFCNDKLDFFIMLSSIAAIVGNRGQAAYAAANTFLDALAHHRQLNGQPAASLNLTAVEDIGYLANNSGRKSEVLKNISSSSMSEAEVLGLVEAAVAGELGKLSRGQCITGLDLENPSVLPFWANDGKFHHIREQALAASASLGSSTGSHVSVSQSLKHMASKDEALDLVASELGEKLASILMMAPEDMVTQKSNMSITAFGLDSLNAIELRNWIGKELQVHLQVLELLTSGKLSDLAALILKKTRLVGPWAEQAI